MFRQNNIQATFNFTYKNRTSNIVFSSTSKVKCVCDLHVQIFIGGFIGFSSTWYIDILRVYILSGLAPSNILKKYPLTDCYLQIENIYLFAIFKIDIDPYLLLCLQYTEKQLLPAHLRKPQNKYFFTRLEIAF